jgi:3-oxoadipate enol-lactonase
MPYITTGDGCRIFYRLDGHEDAPVVVFANSLGTTLEMWDAQAAALAGRYCVLRYDARGHGRSGVAPGPYRCEQFGQDVLALLDGLSLGRVTFCGLSLGGMVGMWLGIHAGKRLERLVLANTSARFGIPAHWNERISIVRAHGMAEVAPIVIKRWFTKEFEQQAPETVARIRDMLLAADPEGYVAACALPRDIDLSRTIANIRTPTLVIAGRHDLATPMEHARLIAEEIPGARLVELDAAHLSNIEQADAFNRLLLDFLDGRELAAG